MEVGEPASGPTDRPPGPPNPRRLLELAPKYGVEFLGGKT
jgi:hypothetical protein